MTHAATLTTEAPDLQALFDQDWTSGKYRRPKCSKADFYAGWLVAYERFKNVAPAEKVSVVAPKHDTPKTPKSKEIQYERSSSVCHGVWVKACTSDGTSSTNTGHLDICGEKHEKIREMRGYRYENGHAMRNTCGEMRQGKHGHVTWEPAAEEHTKVVTYYQGGLPLKRQPTKGPSPNQGNSQYSVAYGQAIPDSLLRKLAIKAGRPAIAP